MEDLDRIPEPSLITVTHLIYGLHSAAIVTGLVAVVWCWAVPDLLLRPLGGWTAVAGIVIGLGDTLIVPALAVTLCGAALMLAGHAWEVRDRRRTLARIPRHQGREAGWVPPA